LCLRSFATVASWTHYRALNSPAIGGELRFVQLDQILGLAARAIQAVVDPLGRTDIEAVDNEADVEAEHRRLNTGDVRRSRSQDFALWRVSV